MAVFESQQRFPPPAANEVMKGFMEGMREVG